MIAVLGIMAALCGGIWLLLTRSTDQRLDEERRRDVQRHYDRMLREMQEDE